MFKHNYDLVDRWLHRIAFHSGPLQMAIADIENAMFAKKLTGISSRKPVFITSLPRAGTTLLLDLVTGLDEFASHKYVDMPFVLCPLMWQLLTKKFRVKTKLIERAHGDGVLMGLDSPEAFEEVLWQTCWPGMSNEGRIQLWSNQRSTHEFKETFELHMRKVILARHKSPKDGPRYVSKNNTNIARIPYLKKMFPDGLIVVPFRNPIDHVRSLHGQHQNFLKIHRSDVFSRAYMKYVGHLEFGELISPIDFESLAMARKNLVPENVRFWEAYWRAAYSHILKNCASEVVFFDYDLMCDDPEYSLTALARVLDVGSYQLVELGRKMIRQSVSIGHSSRSMDVDESTRSIYNAMQDVAINKARVVEFGAYP